MILLRYLIALSILCQRSILRLFINLHNNFMATEIAGLLQLVAIQEILNDARKYIFFYINTTVF